MKICVVYKRCLAGSKDVKNSNFCITEVRKYQEPAPVAQLDYLVNKIMTKKFVTNPAINPSGQDDQKAWEEKCVTTQKDNIELKDKQLSKMFAQGLERLTVRKKLVFPEISDFFSERLMYICMDTLGRV